MSKEEQTIDTPTPPAISPWQYESADSVGKKVHVDIFWDTVSPTKDIIDPGLTGYRDVGCLYRIVLIGVSPNIKTFSIPDGNFQVTRTQLAAQGFSTIDDVRNTNFTLGF